MSYLDISNNLKQISAKSIYCLALKYPQTIKDLKYQHFSNQYGFFLYYKWGRLFWVGVDKQKNFNKNALPKRKEKANTIIRGFKNKFIFCLPV